MKRPSFQFYPGDWAANPNLKRCTFAEKGIWLEVMCLMHDQPEYGVLRWPVREIAEAVKCKPAELQALVRKGVLKGNDKDLESPFVYVPRTGRKDGEPITLVPIQAGPIWYSSRMVKDEHVRIKRGESDGNGVAPKLSPDKAPKPTIGDAFGPRASSSSSPPSGKDSEADASGAGAPPDAADIIFGLGVPLLTAASVLEKNARSMLGMFRKQHGDAAVIDALQRCAQEKPMQPVPWLQALLKAAPPEAKRPFMTAKQRDAADAAAWAHKSTGGLLGAAAFAPDNVIEMEVAHAAQIRNG